MSFISLKPPVSLPHYRWHTVLWASWRDLPALRRPAVWRVWQKQVYFSGIESLPVISLIAVGLGLIVVNQIHFTFGTAIESTLEMTTRLLLSELAPLLTCIFMIARSSSAIASELAAMRVNHEFTVLEQMGIAPSAYLLMPRIWAFTISGAALAVYLLLLTLLSGAIYAVGFEALNELGVLLSRIPLSLFAVFMGKILIFAYAVAVVSCHCGLSVHLDWTAIPVAASRAVLRCLATIFLFDGLWAMLSRMTEATI